MNEAGRNRGRNVGSIPEHIFSGSHQSQAFIMVCLQSGFRCWYLISICLLFQRKCSVYLLICDSLEEVTSPDENRFSQVTL